MQVKSKKRKQISLWTWKQIVWFQIVTSLVLNIIALLFVLPLIGLSTFGIDGDDQLTDLSLYEKKVLYFQFVLFPYLNVKILQVYAQK